MDDVQIQSVRSHDFLELLKAFNQYIGSSIGPRGKIKIVESNGGIMVLTSSSKRLIDWIILDNPLLLVIANAMRSQWEKFSDFGLFTGLASTCLLQNVLNDRYPCSTVSRLFKFFSCTIMSLVNGISVCLKVDFSSLECLTKIVETVISSKPLCCDPASENVRSLAVCVVGAFIRGISENLGALGKITVVVNDGPMKELPYNFTGVLYDSPDWSLVENWRKDRDGKSKILVVVFAVNLTPADVQGAKNSGEFLRLDEICRRTQETSFLEKVEKTCQKLLDAGVTLFACQKVIHPRVKLFLQRKKALALERMGKDLAESFSALTDAIPLGQPSFDEIPHRCIGELDSVNLMERGEKSYLCLGRDDEKSKGIATILVSAPGEQQAAELKVAIDQSLQTLRHLFSKPYLLPGSGCFEAWLVVQLQNKILSNLDELCEEYNCSSIEMLAVLKWFRNSFVNVSRRISGFSGISFMVDSFYNHSWHSEDCEHCACGLVTREMCCGQGAEWLDIELETSEVKLMTLLSCKNSVTRSTDKMVSDNIFLSLENGSKTVHVDVLSSKVNALSLALEICQSILSIGMVVY